MPAIPTIGGVADFWADGDSFVCSAQQLSVGGRGLSSPRSKRTFPMTALSLQDLVAMADETVTVEPDNGSSYIYQQAWFSGLAFPSTKTSSITAQGVRLAVGTD